MVGQGPKETIIPKARRSRGSGVIAIASSLLPGLGHLLTGRRLMGWVLVTVDLVALLALMIVAVWFPSVLLEAWVTPSSLIAITTFNLVVLLYRGAVTADSYLSSVRRGTGDRFGGVVAAAIVVVPHLFIGSLILTQSDLIESLFAPDEPASVAPTTTTTAPTTSARVGDTSSTTLPPATTTTSEPSIWDGYERLNVMLLGSDAGVGRTGTRTDTIILVSIEPESGDVAMFSVPRNLTEAPLPEGMGLWECNCFPDIITHLWANGEWYPEAFPGPQKPSVNALKAAVGLTFGVDVHYYAKVDLAGFVGVVDALGGVTIDVPRRIVDEAYPHEGGGTEYIAFEEGRQYLDGHRALAYARIRRHSGDFARMHRQRCVLGALVEQTSVLDLLRGYGEFATAVKEHVETDVPVDRLPDLIDLVSRVSLDRVATLRITRYNYGAGGHAGYQLYDLDRLRADAHALMADPTVRLETQDGAGFAATCDQSFD
jgi:LCP family protein required for cell wall assembly